MRLLPCCALPVLALTSAAQPLINGPMPGHSDHLEATIWLQCRQACRAQLAYWPIDRPDSVLLSRELVSDPDRAHALEFRMDQVTPGTTYGYRVLVAGRVVDEGADLRFRTQPLWKWRTDPPPFTLAVGSCAYINEPAYDRPGKPYGDGYPVFNAIAAQRPDLMLWLGDNIYLREPDWGTWSGFLHRYTHSRSEPALQRLLRATHHYATWDDHDFGPNDADGSFVNAGMARSAFDLFWPNPGSGVPGAPDGITTAFSHADADFFLMDDRTYRVPPDLRTDSATLLGRGQLDWLVRALKYSDATFKFVAVGGQVLSTAPDFENYATFPRERRELLDRIDREGITGVVFLTGDRHFTELSRMDLPDGRWILDLTASPLTSGTYGPTSSNALQVEGTLLQERGFCTLNVSGPKGQRILTIQAFDTQGAEKWSRSIPQPPARK
ncbi:MAG: alkaline phosphatase family protein [Flavobacteriales bacterium]|nr:alkaline phosphatase family protein [Flavobacteriales bacterium]MBK7941418.1 alkaline phosphatase family protein [Flavobacteriales bacterium]MBK9701483.1 alkaline phosphatase family protein [Flavobacteriales bacterium]